MKPELTIALGKEHAEAVMRTLVEIAPDWALPMCALLIEEMTLGLRFNVQLMKAKHTPNQRNYYHLCVDLLAKHLGYTHDEMHDLVLRAAFGSDDRIVALQDAEGVMVILKSYKPKKRSAKLPVDEYSYLIETLIRMAAFNDFVMPDPENYHVEDRIAAQIRMQREMEP